MKRPKDMTIAEREALPIGPASDSPVAQHYRANDLAFWVDDNGTVWTFGQNADGSWYRQ